MKQTEKSQPPGGNPELQSEAEQGIEIIPTPVVKVDLRDANAIRREIASVYRDMRAGRITGQDGTRLAYVLDMIRKAHETAVLQDRLELLESIIQRRSFEP